MDGWMDGTHRGGREVGNGGGKVERWFGLTTSIVKTEKEAVIIE